MKRASSILAALIIVLVVGSAGYVLHMKIEDGTGIVKDAGDNMSDYSAVFVNGGGIYFGKITRITDKALVLDSVYTYGVVPDTTSAAPTATDTNTATKPTLFDASKVGIAPSSHYNINREQVILWYSLKNDTDVVHTIEDYQSKK